MSESGEKAKKGGKKSGKLLIIGVLGVMLAGGGYFGMASKSKGPEKPKEPELGAMVEMVPEFIVNLRERDVFLRASISFQLDKNTDVHLGADGGGHGGASAPSPEMTALRDAITERLSSLSVSDIRKGDFYDRLRRVLAADANRVLGLLSHKAPVGKKDDKHHEPPKKLTLNSAGLTTTKLKHPDWDAESGPVLKVYVTSFATQHE